MNLKSKRNLIVVIGCVMGIIIMFFMRFILLEFLGCNDKEVSNAPIEPQIMKLADENESNFVIWVDYNEEIDYDIKIFVDDKLCKDGKISGNVGHEVIRYPLNLDNDFHDVTVAIDNKMNSSIRFKVSNECQWLLISHSSSHVIFVPGNGTILID